MRAVQKSGRQAEEQGRRWRALVRRRVESGLTVRAFCVREGLKEDRYYAWQRRLRRSDGEAGRRARAGTARSSSFLLVDPERGEGKTGLELVLRDGRRLRIGRGVDANTLRTVLGVLEPARC